jgi:hypothetical protein
VLVSGGRPALRGRGTRVSASAALLAVALTSACGGRDEGGQGLAVTSLRRTTRTSAPATTEPATTTVGTTTALTPPTRQPVPPAPKPAPKALPTGRQYPRHTGIVATTFWVGELHDASAADGSQVCSTYDARWAQHWSGVTSGAVPGNAPGCPGSPTGGCDGVVRDGRCQTERRDASNGFFPREANPRENPFYVDVPYDDVNDTRSFAQRCTVIPWAGDLGYAGRCGDPSFSYLKNRWVAVVGPNRQTCFGQVQDAGPARYDDAAYVFGANDARPASKEYDGAGIEVSPALNGCAGFAALDGSSDRVSWRFVDEIDVAPGPWRKIITRSPVNQG